MAQIDEDLSFRNATNSVSLTRSFIRSQPPPKKKKKKTCVYNTRRLKSNGTILVLVWNLMVFSYQGLALGTLVKLFPNISKTYPWQAIVVTVLLQECLPLLIYPIAGWIADAKVGRYKVIRWSLWIMWIGSLLLLAEEIVGYSLKDVILSQKDDRETVADEFQYAMTPLVVLVYILNAIAIAGFQANVIPFGVDQMEDGSSEQYSAFIHWYYWTRNGSFGLIIRLMIQSIRGYCQAEQDPHLYELTDRYDLIILLLQVCCVTLAIVLDLLFSDRVLNKDPKTYNPLKKVWRISRFIMKNDRLVGYRKAITFSYNAPPQRSDFAKRLYGGPFEGDDVEDVMTFWKIVVFIFSLGFGGVFVNNIIYFTYSVYVNHLHQRGASGLSPCTTRHAVSELVYPMVFTLVIPLYEFIVYPYFRKYVPRMMKRIALGMILMFLALVGMLVLDSVGHANADTSVCMLYHTHSHKETVLSIPIPMASLIPLIVLMAFGEMVAFIPALEFIIAQSPFGMRGLLIGFFYAIYGLFNGVVASLLLVISLSFKDNFFDVRGLSCGSWLYLVAAVIGAVGILLYFIGSRWYTKRQRGGRMVNHQAIIESYYETTDQDD